MDYDPRDFVESYDQQFEDEMDAMTAEDDYDVDVASNYRVSDDLLKAAMEEEAALMRSKQSTTAQPSASSQSFDSTHPSTTAQLSDSKSTQPASSDPMETQLRALRESLNETRNRSPAVKSQESPIQFSFMSNSSSASTPSIAHHSIQISNSYKRKSTSTALQFGESSLPLEEEEEEEEKDSKRPKTDPEYEKVYTRVPEGDFIRVSSDSQRVFLKVKPFIAKVTLSSATGTFLAEPFQYLKSKVMRDYHEKKAEVAQTVERLRSHVIPAATSHDAPSENLWVNTYLPNRYIELLSDDGVNRQVLHWIKLWDGIVFGRKMKEKVPAPPPKWQTMEQFQKFKKFQEPEYDESGFPFKKTILLAGPPGLGKTTLAHVVAEHAGYNVVEMNASDDRSASAFAEMIENSVRMTAVMSRDNRPNCLIIDEIDGAGAPAIQVLVKVLTAGQTKEEKTGPKKKKKTSRLRRPIICICNDPWGAALRDLRKIATIVTFPQTQSARLAYRLKNICNIEALTADMASLLYLCEKTDNDIRSSLNTLQFLKAKSEPLSMVKLRDLAVGSKDMQQNLYKFWSTIFTQPKAKGNALQRGPSSDQQRLSDLLKLVSSTGEFEKQVEGVHENLLLLKIREAKFNSLVSSLDWFIFYDAMSDEVHKHMSWELYSYLMYVPIAFHYLFAVIHPPKVVIPSSSRETKQRQQSIQETCDMIRRETLPKARLPLTPTYMSTEFVSYLTRMLCPIFRPVSVQLYSEKEKEAKLQLVETMACYDLQFVQSRTPEGLTQFNLEPDVYGMTSFPGVVELKQLPYSIKQMLAREVDLKRISGVDAAARPEDPSSNEAEEKTEGVKQKVDFSKEAEIPVNYLAKIVGNKSAFLRKKDSYVQKSRCFFKFNEGYSNAVRKPVKMSSFL